MIDPQNNIIRTMTEKDISALANSVYTATANACYREMLNPDVEEVDDGLYQDRNIERITGAARAAVRKWFEIGDD